MDNEKVKFFWQGDNLFDDAPQRGKSVGFVHEGGDGCIAVCFLNHSVDGLYSDRKKAEAAVVRGLVEHLTPAAPAPPEPAAHPGAAPWPADRPKPEVKESDHA